MRFRMTIKAILVLAVATSAIANQPVVYVGCDSLCYNTIYDGIQAVSPGGTVYVHPGTYWQNSTLVIDKEIKLIALEGPQQTIITSSEDSTIIYITESWVLVDGFTINRHNNWSDYGIHIISGNNVIQNNTIRDHGVNIGIFGSQNRILNNTLDGDFFGGIFMVGNNNQIMRNVINSGDYDIRILSGTNNTILQNNFYGDMSVYEQSNGNVWSFPHNGNFWHNHTGSDPVDIPGDGDGMDYDPSSEPWPDWSVKAAISVRLLKYNGEPAANHQVQFRRDSLGNFWCSFSTNPQGWAYYRSNFAGYHTIKSGDAEEPGMGHHRKYMSLGDDWEVVVTLKNKEEEDPPEYEQGPTRGNLGSKDDPHTEIPTSMAINTVTPNPFNPRTTVWLDVPQTGGVTLAIHDLRGRLVRTLLSGQMTEGRHSVVWDGMDDRGAQAPSGVYLVRLVTTDGAQQAVKVTLSK